MFNFKQRKNTQQEETLKCSHQNPTKTKVVWVGTHPRRPLRTPLYKAKEK